MNNSRILITGGTGSLGQELVKQLLKNNEVVIYSRNEERQFEMKKNLGPGAKAEFHIGDIRDTDTLTRLLSRCDYAIHAAAMKDLIFCEKQVSQTIFNNIDGSMSFIKAAEKSKTLKKVLAVSTDKAAAPSNVYGCSKYIMEKLFEEASRFSDITFASVRFGNMIDSKGSLISHWKHNPQLDVKITHPEVARFFFSLEDAGKTVLTAMDKAKNGEIYIKHMKAARIKDILEIIFKKDSFEVMGLFPGEKVHEDLLSATEIGRCFFKDGYYIIDPEKTNPNPPDIHSTRNAEYFTKQELAQLIEKVP